jgi:hypothetical protein
VQSIVSPPADVIEFVGALKLLISAQISSPAFFLGDTIPLTLKYNFSNCKSPHSFQVELMNSLILMIPPNHYKHDRCSLSKAVAKCQAKEGTIEFAMKTSKVGNKISTMLRTNIRCDFFIVVTPKFGCCVSAGDLSCQIMVIMSSKFPHMIMPAPPPEWSPEVLQSAFIQAPPQPPGMQPPETKPDHPSALELPKSS